MKKAVILDTSAIIYRSYFALMGMRNSKGQSTGAVYGFINTLNSILNEFKPDYILACLDVKRSELKRTQELESYKAHREDMPIELVHQLPLVHEVLEYYQITTCKEIGYEADDLIATFSTKFKADDEDIEVYIITGDKDLAQLVEEDIYIALLGKGEGKNSFKFVKNDDDVLEYLGVRPCQITDLFGLMGDKSDGIPGVKGIGIKTGVELISKYDNLENLYEHIDEIKGKRKEKLIEDKDNAFLSRSLATVDRNIEVEYCKNKLTLKEKETDKLIELYKKLEFKKFLSNEEKEKKEQGNTLFSLNQNNNEAKEETTQATPYELELLNSESLFDKLSTLKNEVSIFEHDFGLSFSDGDKTITVLKQDEENNYKEKRKVMFETLKDKKAIAYNIKDLFIKDLENEKYFDIMLAWYVLGTETSQDLENIIFNEFGENLEKYSDMLKRTKADGVSEKEKAEFLSERSYYILELKDILKNKLEREDLDDVFYSIENKLAPVLAGMEKTGIKIDKEYFQSYSDELKVKLEGLKKEIYTHSEVEFNIDSPKQLSEILFEKMLIEPVKKIKTGFSTDAEVLEVLANRGIEIASKLLEYRTYTKLLTTYVEPLPKLIDTNDRIHTTYLQNGTSTGRLSSTNPNLQNIPVKTDEGIKIRKGFIAAKGKSLLSFDYSQIELRVLAELSKDHTLIKAYKENKDLHDLTARKLFYKTEEEPITRKERAIAKVINFSILYGKTPFGLSKELGIPVSEAKLYIDKYFEEYPMIKQFLIKTLDNARLNGYVETLFGTRRYINNINSKNKNLQSQADRMAVNAVVQGTAANIMKIVMIKIHDKLKDKGDTIKMLLQVHDELIFEVKDENIDECMKHIEKLMEDTIELDDVKLRTNGAVAKNWGDLK